MSAKKFCLDANALITPWNQLYPPSVFGSLWEKIASKKEQIVIIKPIFDEIDPPTEKTLKKDKNPLRYWLIENGFAPTKFDLEDKSIQLEKKYEVQEISEGVGPVDIKIICYAKENRYTVVTFEGKQKQKPGKITNYKIPLVCHEEGVKCIDFIAFLQELEITL